MSLRIMIASAPPWALTGYGQQIGSLIPRLQKDGHTVSMVPLAGFHGGFAQLGGVDYFPPQDLSDKGNNTIIEAYAKAWDADIVLSLTDAWVLDGYGAGKFRWVPWVPIDGDPLGPAIKRVMPAAWRIISMSRHGEKNLAEAGFGSTYIPHAFESTFKPDLTSRKQFRKEFWGVPEDAFVFGSVGLNYAYPGRKGFDRLLEAFKAFSEGKENVYLYLHCDPRPMSSLDLEAVVEAQGLKGKVLFPKILSYLIGYTPITMASMYNAMDCFVLATHGEGFGIPVLEALACGVPVIATDCTSMPEIVTDGVTGNLVPPVTRYMNPGHYYHYLIDIPALTEALEDLYRTEHFPGVMGQSVGKAGPLQAARWPNLKAICRKTVEEYEWDNVYAMNWRPFLEDCEREIRSGSVSNARSGATITFLEDRVRKTDGPTARVKEGVEILSKLDHPNIIKVLDTGTDEWGRFWYEMPRYKYTLSEEHPGPEILDGIRSALDYLHSKGIAHRDLHPANVVYDTPDKPVLIDFNWATETVNAAGIDYQPWNHMSAATPRSQRGDMAGYHRIVAHVRGIALEEAQSTAMPGVPYQQIDGAGERDCQKRWDLMQPDVKGKSVADFGCNLGWFLGKAREEGAVLAVGYERDLETVRAAMLLRAGCFFHVRDIEEPGGFGKYDVGFCLSVLQHLKNPEATLAELRAVCDVLYVEVPEGVVDITEGELLGYSERERPIIRFSGNARSGNRRAQGKSGQENGKLEGRQAVPQGQVVGGKA